MPSERIKNAGTSLSPWFYAALQKYFIFQMHSKAAYEDFRKCFGLFIGNGIRFHHFVTQSIVTKMYLFPRVDLGYSLEIPSAILLSRLLALYLLIGDLLLALLLRPVARRIPRSFASQFF